MIGIVFLVWVGGLVAKVLASSLVSAPLLGLCWPIDWLCSGVNAWGGLESMIGVVGVND